MFFHCLPLHDNFKLPTSGVDGLGELVDPDSVGFDLYAPESGSIDPLSRKLVKLGFASSFTSGYIGLLLDRSGMGNKGIHRFAGVIDPSYRKEWAVILYNSNPHTFEWQAGDRIVQVVFFKIEKPTPIIVTELEESTRVGGFGSTGQ
jgi:deoxyuridine 5'-triphosphate nucleotidohydrolase